MTGVKKSFSQNNYHINTYWDFWFIRFTETGSRSGRSWPCRL